MKNVFKRFLSLLLTLVLVVTLLPAMAQDVFAATQINGLDDEKIQLSVNDNNGTWTANGTEINGSVTGTAKSSCGNASSKKSTLTITNEKGNEAQLSFNYTVTLANGKVTIGDENITASGTYKGTLGEGDHVDIYLESAVGASTTSIKITNISLVVDADVNMTFKAPENSSYSVNGQIITEETVITQRSTEPFVLKATPASGYKFAAWVDDKGKIITKDMSTTQYFEADTTLTAKFVSTDTAVFESQGFLFDDLGEAVTWSQANSSNKITLISNGSISGNYTIPSGITLLIPFDSQGTVYTTSPATTQSSYVAPSSYRTLSMASGASLTVENGGVIDIPSKMSATGTGSGCYSGTPTGPHGKIQMNADSEIILESGAKMYAWGYVAGQGTVTAKSGSTVYEMFQVRDFRGGSATLGMSSKAVFPMNQYYVQNVESKLIFEAGAKETVACAITMSGSTNSASAEFIGDKGMFQLANGTMSKEYDPKTDRLIVNVDGDATISSISLSMGGASINSANYPLPINSNITIKLNSGTATVNQDLDLLPGSEMYVANGAEVNIKSGKNVYVYDKDQWGNYAAEGAQLVTIGYTAAAGKAPGIRNANSLIDAKVDINGTVTVNGGFYTTESGANIISSEGTGKVNFAVAAGTKKNDYQVTQSGTSTTQISIPIIPAKLRNDVKYAGTEEEYTLTKDAKAGDLYNYDTSLGKWMAPAVTFTITYDKNADDAEGTMAPQTLTSGVEGTLNKNTFTRDGYKFVGWAMDPNGATMIIPDEYSGIIPATDDLTLYAQWEKEASYTVTWKNADGTILETDENVKPGDMPEYNGETPTMDDAQYTYTFSGWDKEFISVTEDVTYTATYETEVKTYTVTWTDSDGTVLEVDNEVPYGTVPTYDGDTPVKEDDSENIYTFSGWTPDVIEVTENVTYTATYSKKAVTYTVKWINSDGTALETDEDVPYGSIPSYDGATPEKAETAAYTYEFTCWTPDVTEVTGDVTYTAVYAEHIRSYTVTWENADGSVLREDTYEYGKTPSYGADTPVMEMDDQYSYIFVGWEPELSEVTKDITYKAVYEKNANKYTVIWKNFDGTVLETDNEVPYGTVPAYDGEIPVKESTDEHTYIFSGWNPEVVAVSGDVEYTATFTESVNTYTVKWMLDEETVLKTDTDVPYGTHPVFSGVTPSKDPTLYVRYEFAGWSLDEATTVTGDVSFYALFEEIKNSGWTEFDGKRYYIENETVLTGVCTVVDPEHEEEMVQCVFDYETGEFLSDLNGVYVDQDDTYYIKDGRVVDNAGLVRVITEDGSINYYYFGEDGKAVKKTEEGNHFLVENNNDLPLIEGINYVFDENGVIVHFADTSINGIYYDSDTDNYYYCIDGIIIANGLMYIDDNYYYARSSNGAFVRNCSYWITLTHGLLEDGIYNFDETGKIVFPEETPEKEGIVEENGSLYYYVNGKITPAGLIEMNGDYYYVRTSNGEVVHGRSYWVTKTNDLPVPVGAYEFDSEGKMINPPEVTPEEPTVKNGIMAENGSLYYYVDGKITPAGLIEIDGDYYYVRTSNGEVIHGRSYWVAVTNGLPVPEGTYSFDSEGKMINPPTDTTVRNGIVAENGSLYYYVDGKIIPAGLIEIDGDYYYVRTSNGEVIHGRSYWVTMTNGLLKEGNYQFAEDGKMIIQ